MKGIAIVIDFKDLLGRLSGSETWEGEMTFSCHNLITKLVFYFAKTHRISLLKGSNSLLFLNVSDNQFSPVAA